MVALGLKLVALSSADLVRIEKWLWPSRQHPKVIFTLTWTQKVRTPKQASNGSGLRRCRLRGSDQVRRGFDEVWTLEVHLTCILADCQVPLVFVRSSFFFIPIFPSLSLSFSSCNTLSLLSCLFFCISKASFLVFFAYLTSNPSHVKYSGYTEMYLSVSLLVMNPFLDLPVAYLFPEWTVSIAFLLCISVWSNLKYVLSAFTPEFYM